MSALAQTAAPAHLGWIVAAIVVILGLLYGWKDLARFSSTRVFAVAGVSYRDAIRRRVLWITPLAIIGVLIVSQLAKPLDEQDAINKTIRIALFATAMVLTVTTIILACTTLPKEIDSRVIYTIVTKPITRLEIVLGKIIGLARVSAVILLIMGGFTYGYLLLRSWSLGRVIDAKLELLSPNDPVRPQLEFLRERGLLRASELGRPSSLQILNRMHEASDPIRWISGDSTQDFVVPFDIDPKMLPRDELEGRAAGPIIVKVRLRAERPKDFKEDELANIPAPILVQQQAMLAIQVLDSNLDTIISTGSVNNGRPSLIEADGQEHEVVVEVAAAATAAIRRDMPEDRPVRFFIQIVATTPRFDYGATERPIVLTYQPVNGDRPIQIEPAGPAWFRGRRGAYGFQIPGGEHVPFGVYEFSNVDVSSATGEVVAELKTSVERSGTSSLALAPVTDVSFQVRNVATGALSAPVVINPESFRYARAILPVEQMRDGHFQIIVRSNTPYHWISLRPAWFHVVTAERSFALNLLKSLGVLWLLTILVSSTALLTSTFVSWPIAVVLTVVVLLSHWGVRQLSDVMMPGLGRSVATDLGLKDAASSRVVSTSVDALSTGITQLSSILPDISQFAAIEYIEQGIAMPFLTWISALKVIALFAVPVIVLAYVLLRNKEVAP